MIKTFAQTKKKSEGYERLFLAKDERSTGKK